MKRNVQKILCLAVVLAMLLCGCGADTAETEQTETRPQLTAAEVAANMQQALQQTPCSKLEMTMELSMSMAAEGMDKMEMSLKTSTETALTQEPVSSHSAVVTQMGYGGEPVETKAESYMVVEEGALVTYTHSDGVWMKNTTGQTPEEYLANAATVTFDPGNISIDETVTQWNGRSAICLKSQMDGDSIQGAVDGVLSSMGSLLGETEALVSGADYTKLACSVVLYLDPETFLPMAQEMTFTGLADVVAPLLQDLGVTVEIPTYTASAQFLSYEPQPAMALPEGAAQKAEAWSRLLVNEPDNGDGTFTIREGMALIDIVQPQRFEVKEKDYDHVTFRRDDYRQITYTMYYINGDDTTGEVFMNSNDKAEERWTTMGGGSVEREQMALTTDTMDFTCDLLATTWESGREDANLYAWSVVGSDAANTYYLHVEVTDGYNDGMGFSKNADITAEEFAAYLNAASPSKLTAE